MNAFLLAPAALRRSTPIRLGIAALLAGLVPAQTWLQLQPAVRPPGRQLHNMAFDSARNVMLLFGGTNFLGARNDTWTWNGVDWAPVPLGVVPPPRWGAGMVYDAARQRVVLFGGCDAGSRGDTWTWDGVAWLERTPLHTPAARYGLAMAYDAAHAQTVLFGGYNGIVFDDTWTWDGTDWMELAPAHSPPGRWFMNMAHDTARGRCVLFGGGGFGTLGDTWEWDGIDWAQQLPAHAPSPRYAATLAYDAAHQRVALFGGDDEAGSQRLGDTWEYDGVDWVLQALPMAPSPRRFPVMAYDEAHAHIVLFGGSTSGGPMDDTWRYAHGVAAGTFAPFGQGCPGGVGTPQLALDIGMPIVGTTFKVACTNLQLDHFTTMWLGFSNTNWALGTLPYDLGPLGMTGCTLFVSGDIVTMLLNWNGIAFWQMTIPNAPQLVGLPFYLQAGVIDHVNALGMVVTNAAEVRVGDH